MMIRRVFGVPGWDFGRPFEEFDRLKRQMDLLGDSLMGRVRGRQAGVFPLINLTEDKDNYYVRAELPGLKTEELDIQATGTTLSLMGERKIPNENGGSKYHRREREAGKFSRMVSLGNEIDPTRVDAKLANGILTVVLPKSEKNKPKQIMIKQ